MLPFFPVLTVSARERRSCWACRPGCSCWACYTGRALLPIVPIFTEDCLAGWSLRSCWTGWAWISLSPTTRTYTADLDIFGRHQKISAE